MSTADNLRTFLDALEAITSTEAAVIRARAEASHRFEVSSRALVASDIFEEREALEVERRALRADVERLTREVLRLAGKRADLWERAASAAERALRASIEERDNLATLFREMDRTPSAP